MPRGDADIPLVHLFRRWNDLRNADRQGQQNDGDDRWQFVRHHAPPKHQMSDSKTGTYPLHTACLR